jgi:hypothetical protein
MPYEQRAIADAVQPTDHLVVGQGLHALDMPIGSGCVETSFRWI